MRRAPIRLLAPVLALATAAGIAGCTPSSTADTAAGSASSGSSQELTVWHYYSVEGQTAGLDALGADFEASHPGVEVNDVYVPFDQLTNKLVQAAGTQSGPDVVIFNAADTYTLGQAGAIKPMDEWWAQYPDAAQFPDAVIQKVDGKTYGVQGFVNLIGLWYNADLLASVGITEPPATFEQLEADMATVKAAGKDAITLTGKPNSEGEWQAYPWLSRNGWDYANPQQAALEETFSMVQDWTAKGYLSKEAATWDQTVPFQQFTAGNTAFAVNGNWQVASAKKDAKFTYGVVPLPTDAGSVYLGGEAQNIGAFSANPDLAKEYLEQEFFSAKGELTLLNAFGSIPSRADAAQDPAVSSDPILSVFSKVVAEDGHASPDRAIPATNVAKVLQTVGESWSAAIAGTGTPSDLSGQLITTLTPELAQ